MKRDGFTLIEILIVIAILGILMAMMVPAAGMIMRRAKKAQAQADSGVACSVMLKYNMEYNRWPSFYSETDEHLTDADWVSVMSPAPGDKANPDNMKRMVFFAPGKGALGKEGKHVGAFVDPWGNPFRYEVDTLRNGEIQHPDPEETKRIRGRIIAWSAGPDGDYTTWSDNPTSWE